MFLKHSVNLKKSKIIIKIISSSQLDSTQHFNISNQNQRDIQETLLRQIRFKDTVKVFRM
jgi:hypothetical protein